MAEFLNGFTGFMLVVGAIIGVWHLVEQLVRGEWRRWWRRRPWMHDDVSSRASMAGGYVPLQLASPFETMDDAFARMDEAFARMDEQFDRIFKAAAGTCPACEQLRLLHAQFPHLTPAQLAAVLARQIALGRCPPHQVGEPHHE